MKTLFNLILCALASSGTFAQKPVYYTVHYSPQMQTDGLKVTVAFQKQQAGDSTYFHYSNNVWGEENLVEALIFPKQEDEGVRFRVVPDSNRIVVYHPWGKKVTFSYCVKQNTEEESDVATNRPRTNDQFFHVLGENLFTVPEEYFGKENDPTIKAEITWEGFPEKYTLSNSFGTNKKIQKLELKLWGDLYHSVFVGGDYRIHSFSHNNKPIYLIIRGEWLGEYSDENLLNALQQTISTQRDFWNDHDFPQYTVFMTPTVTRQDSTYRGSSLTGSGIHYGFMVQATNNPFNNWDRMEYILNHEMMHDWIGGKIQIKSAELNYWFSEGFTDYYTYKNRLRSGNISFDEWLGQFNEDVFAAHWNNPKRNEPNYRVKDDFWKSRDIEKIPYRRGALFAFWLDNQIQLKSNGKLSLDDLMRELLAKCQDEHLSVSDDLFIDIANNYLNENISYFFQKHILVGEDIDWTSVPLIKGFAVEMQGEVPVLNSSGDLSKIYLQQN